MTERFLQYIWQHQLFQKNKQMSTTDGHLLTIQSAGEINRDAGPDFFNAKITLDGIEWVGNIEIHIQASDWNAHHHSADKRYNNIILHVVLDNNCEVVLEDGRRPATLQVKEYLLEDIEQRYTQLMESSLAGHIACASRVKQLPSFLLANLLERMTVERIAAKSATVNRLLEESKGGWNQTCYWLLAHYFGGRVNAFPFELMAKSTDLRLLSRWHDDPQRIEAILLGQAGFLEGYFEDEYPRQLQADYMALKTGASLKPIDAYLWKFYCLRPASFPTIRISQFAQLISQCPNLFDELLSMKEVSKLEAFFNQEASPYWNTHYQFDTPQPKSSSKRLGKSQAHILIVNAWVPLLFTYGEVRGMQVYKEQALEILQQLPPENNNIIRQWESNGISPENAAQSQALLQLHNEYCQRHRCLECSLGYYVIKNT